MKKLGKLNMVINSIIIIILLNSFLVYGQGKKVDTIVEKVFNAAGGRENWENITTRIDFSESVNSSNMIDVNNHFSHLKYSTNIKLYKKLNDVNYCDRFITIDKTNLEDTFTTCYNGEKYWSQKSNSAPINYEYFAERYSKFVNCGYPCWLLRADSIIYSDSLSLMEDNYEVLEVYIAATPLIFYVNNQNFLLDKYYRKDKPSTITFFSDYRIIQRRNIPFLQETYQNGGLASSVKLLTVKFDIELDIIYFKFPQYPPYYILAKPLDITTF